LPRTVIKRWASELQKFTLSGNGDHRMLHFNLGSLLLSRAASPEALSATAESD
jgi:hypothetical protein